MITLLFSTSHLFFWRGKNLWLGFHTNVCILKLNLRYFWSINLGVIGNGHTDLTQGNYSNEQANTCEHQETDLQSYFKSLELMGPKPKDNSSKFPEFFCLASKIEGGRISLWQTRPQRLTEVWVLHGLFGSQSLLMVISQKFVQKIQGLRADEVSVLTMDKIFPAFPGMSEKKSKVLVFWG